MKASGNLIEFNQSHFLEQFSGALTLFDSVLETARQIAAQPIRKIFFVACGAPHHLFYSLQYWAAKFSANTTFFRYFPAEFLANPPQVLDANSLVILGSHSGTTKETVAAARHIQQTPAQSIAITQSADSPLGQVVNRTIAYGNTEQGYFSAFMLTSAFLSEFLAHKEPHWPLHNALITSLPHFPAALAEAKAQTLHTAAHQAEKLKDSQPLYVIGAGPMYTTAYVLANCFLMEMQWMHAHALQAAEFFHGPFEVVDETTPLLLLIGEDPSRPIAERVLAFTRQYAQNTIVYDSKEFPMSGIAPQIRPLVAPMIVDAALTNLVETLAVLRNHPMSTRRYMGKVAY